MKELHITGALESTEWDTGPESILEQFIAGNFLNVGEGIRNSGPGDREVLS